MTEHPPDPELAQLQAEIAETRAELADTVDQLAEKLDVKAQASRTAHQAVERATATAHAAAEKATATAHQAADKVRQSLPDAATDKLDQAAGGLQRMAGSDQVRQHRKQLLLGAGAVLVALVLWSRRRSS